MRKFFTLAGLAVAVVGFGSLSGSAAFAAGCLNPDNLPPMTLSHNDMDPNNGFGYNKGAYDAQLAKGNSCGMTPQSYRTDRDVLQSTPNTPAGENGNSVITGDSYSSNDVNMR